MADSAWPAWRLACSSWLHQLVDECLFSLALLAYLDRSNISFAAQDLKNDTGIDDEAYGFGSSAFFVGCVEAPLPPSRRRRP